MIYTDATSHAAGRYGTDRLNREIENRGTRQVLQFTAGGVAAGKSSAVSKEMIDQSGLVYDGTLRDVPWAIETIEKAIANGWRVGIDYVQRPLPLAARGAILRAEEEGRWFPLRNLPKAQQDAQKAIVSISKHFSGNPNVAISLWLNDSADFSTKPREINVSDIDQGGGDLHYPSGDELDAKNAEGAAGNVSSWIRETGDEIARVLGEEARSGRISKEILDLSARGSEQLTRIVEQAAPRGLSMGAPTRYESEEYPYLGDPLEDWRQSGHPEAGIVNPIDPALDPDQKVEALRALSQENIPLVEKILADLQQREGLSLRLGECHRVRQNLP